MSFDFIEVKDAYDFGFTYTEAWSPGFALLDYESCNFVENLGSIGILIVLFMIWISFSVLWFFMSPKCGSKWFTSKLEKLFITQSIFRFFLETYFELLISSVLVLGYLKIKGIRSILNTQDKISLSI